MWKAVRYLGVWNQLEIVSGLKQGNNTRDMWSFDILFKNELNAVVFGMKMSRFKKWLSFGLGFFRIIFGLSFFKLFLLFEFF